MGKGPEWASLVVQRQSPPAVQKTQFRSLRQKDPLEKEMATHSNTLFLSVKSHGQGTLVDTVHGVTEESDIIQQLNDKGLQLRPFPRRYIGDYIDRSSASLPLKVDQMLKNLPAVQETQVRSLGRGDFWEKEMQPTPVFLPREFMERGTQ